MPARDMSSVWGIPSTGAPHVESLALNRQRVASGVVRGGLGSKWRDQLLVRVRHEDDVCLPYIPHGHCAEGLAFGASMEIH